MNSDHPIRKRGTSRLVVGLKQGVEHGISARIETADGDVIVIRNETLGALVQAYMDVFTHPTTNAVELLAATIPNDTNSPEEFHLIPGDTSEEVLREQLAPATAAPTSATEEATKIHRDSIPEGPLFDEEPDGSSGGLETRAMQQLDHTGDEDHRGWQTRDDGPVFGDTPTHHSAPSYRPQPASEARTVGDTKSETDDLD
jgi:hypothetical protein